MATDNSPDFTRRAFLTGIGGTAAGSAVLGSAVLGSVTGWVPPAAASTTAMAAVRVEAARSGFAATVSPDGSWQVTTSAPAWTFAGSVGVPVSDVRQAVGRDRIGPYQQVDFSYQADGTRGGSIRVYDDTPIVLFAATNLTAAANSAPFPVFTSYPQLPHQLSYSGIFGIYQFNTFSSASDSPWMYFDGNGDAFVLSAANHFEQAATVAGAQADISCGVMSSITELPAGFTQQTILAAGHGIGAVHHIWGGALTSLSGKILPASDDGIVLNKLGYWTDHGATYYYDYESALGYTGTLKAVVDDWAEKNLPIGYMQLDSWWYPKGPQALWTDSADGEYLYEADSQLFPDGLAAFREQIGLPLLTHARWIDPSSPYQQEYQTSGGVVIDPRFWENRMRYLRDAGVVTYEQDWLGAGAQPVYNLTAPGEFFGNMARYAAANGLTIEYCMPLPRNYLQTTLYDNVTHLRVSNDRFDSGKWDQFLYDSQLARSIGMWPWSDVFMSTETTNLLLSNLSAGPVGVGDPIGQESQANLMQVVRPDGVIVKPDVPIVPDDQTYLAEAADSTTPPMVAWTYSDHTDLRYGYVFSYARNTPSQTASFQPSALGVTGSAYVYDYFAGTGTLVQAGGDYQQTVTSGSYWVVAPVGPSGIAFLGDAGKFVSLGKKRITSVSDHGTVQAAVAFAPGEDTVTLQGYSPTSPGVEASPGAAGPVTYDPATGIFSVQVSPGPADSAAVTIAPGRTL
jgi:hypothetical protein